MDNELLLFDRIETIRQVNAKHDLLHNAYLSFSGGKDSTVLHHLLDMALPNNEIPRVYIDTGIEYKMVRDFVFRLAKDDPRFRIIHPSKPLKPMLESQGYPFKSKEHSIKVGLFQDGSKAKSVLKYASGQGNFSCPKFLLYQFEEGLPFKVGGYCCLELKKKPAKKWMAENGKSITMTGMRKDEGGQRANIGCILTDKEGKLRKFHPLLVVPNGWEEWFIERERIELCELYKPPYNFKRTGCKGCPFALDLQEQLTKMALYLPNERAQCEALWKPVYEEYRRIGFRLDKTEQFKLF